MAKMKWHKDGTHYKLKLTEKEARVLAALVYNTTMNSQSYDLFDMFAGEFDMEHLPDVTTEDTSDGSAVCITVEQE
jgi:hypothetical protein